MRARARAGIFGAVVLIRSLKALRIIRRIYVAVDDKCEIKLPQDADERRNRIIRYGDVLNSFRDTHVFRSFAIDRARISVIRVPREICAAVAA